MGSVGEVCLCAALYKLFVDERPSESKVSLSDGLVYCAPSVASADGEFKIKFPFINLSKKGLRNGKVKISLHHIPMA